MIICYKVSLFTEIQARLFYKLPEFIGLPNIIIKRKAIPELIQHDLTPEKLAEMALEIINDPEKYEKQKQDLAEVVSQLGEPGAHERVAQIVTELLDMPSQG
jgi:lipid-A-disaccharide synthase